MPIEKLKMETSKGKLQYSISGNGKLNRYNMISTSSNTDVITYMQQESSTNQKQMPQAQEVLFKRGIPKSLNYNRASLTV